MKKSNDEKGQFDVDSFLEDMEDYSGDNDEVLNSVADDGDFGSTDDIPVAGDEDFGSTDDIPVADEEDFGGVDDLPVAEEIDTSAADEDFGFDFDGQTAGVDDSYDENQEQSADDYLRNFSIEDEDLKEVTLEDYNIQEDVVLDNGKRSIGGAIKGIVIAVFVAIAAFLVITCVAFFSSYTLVPEKIKNCDWTNGNYSVISKDYIVNFKDLYYGQTIMYLTNSDDFIKDYRYATIIDTKMNTPRAIKCFDNATGDNISISIENVCYIVDTDINEGIMPPQYGVDTETSIEIDGTEIPVEE